jgi:lipopolysaccharide/colanic/teichoic acid biosynthesis glycosyltransferase
VRLVVLADRRRGGDPFVGPLCKLLLLLPLILLSLILVVDGGGGGAIFSHARSLLSV